MVSRQEPVGRSEWRIKIRLHAEHPGSIVLPIAVAGRFAPLAECGVPRLAHIFDGMVVRASPQALQHTLAVFVSHGADIVRESLPTGEIGTGLGHARRTHHATRAASID